MFIIFILTEFQELGKSFICLFNKIISPHLNPNYNLPNDNLSLLIVQWTIILNLLLQIYFFALKTSFWGMRGKKTLWSSIASFMFFKVVFAFC